MCASERHGTYHDTAQICLNGHIVNTESDSRPEFNERFCSRCGASVITACPNCGTSIIGTYRHPDVFHTDRFPELVSVPITKSPRFCSNCGKPYPWTESAVEAAKELARELDNLTEEEKGTLERSIDEIVRDTPQATVATNRFKRLVSKAGKGASELFRSLLANVVSETIKRSIWGP